MFSNPLFQVWVESLEERRLQSATEVGQAPLQASIGNGAGVDVSVTAARPLAKLADRAPMSHDDNAFVTEWFIADDHSS